MTTTDAPTTTTPDDVRAAVDRLGRGLQQRAPEIEAARSLPSDVLDALVSAGCFRLLVPSEIGGAGANPAEAYAVFEALARADASVGWLVMIGSGTWIDLSGLPRPTFDAVVGRGDLLAGVFSPSGVAEPVDGGYRVSGRWAFASGCGHSRWIYGNCIDAGGDEPVVRAVVLPTDEVRIEDTWRVLGLRATGSHHFSVDGAFVPAERTCTDADPRALETPILRIPPPALFSLALASVALGTARGALDEITHTAADRTPLLAAGSLVTNPLHHHDTARAESDLRAARALLYERAADLWAAAEAGDPITLAARAHTRSAAVWITARAAEVVRWAYRAGGGRSVYDEHPLQRRLRDVQTMAQHFLVRDDTLVTAGAALSGQELDVPVF